MKKHVALGAIGLGLVGLVAAMASWDIGGDVARRLAEPSFTASGLTLARVDSGRFSLLPVPRLTLSGVELRDGPGTLGVTALALRGTLRLPPLLTGRVDIGEVTLTRPAFVVARASAESALRGVVGLSPVTAEAADPGLPATTAIHKLVIIDGSVATRDKAGVVEAPLTALNAIVTGLAPGLPLDVTATVSWRGEVLDLKGSGLQLSRTRSSAPVPIEMSVTSDLVSARLSGRTTGGSPSQLDADMLLRTTQVDRLAALLGLDLPLPLTGPLELAGDLRVKPGDVSLNSARIGLPAGQFDGVLALRTSGDHLLLDGTLATEKLDVEGALAPLLPTSGPDGWSHDSYDARVLPRGDVDLRLSASKLTSGRVQVANAALSLMAKGGRFDAVLSSGEAYGGTVKARLSASPGAAGYDVKLAASAERIEAGAALAGFTDSRRLTGTLSASVQVEGSGESPWALMRSLEGRASAALRQGELVGVNVPDLLKRVERRPLITAFDTRGGRTAVEVGTVTGRIGKGVLELAEGTLKSANARIVLTGQVNIAERQFNLSGLAMATAETANESLGLPFDVLGSFDDPQILPDAKSLIRRSGAAAPFLQPRPPVARAGSADALAPLDRPVQ